MNFLEIIEKDTSKEITLFGKNDLYIIKEDFNNYYYNRKIFKDLKSLKKYIYENNNENVLTLEELNIEKFKYKKYKHDPEPRILVIDYNYSNDCILGINLNYLEDFTKIKEVYKFAKTHKLNNKENYDLLVKEYPTLKKYIRTYKKNSILKRGKK